MGNESEDLLTKIKNEINPLIIASHVSAFISSSLKVNKISLYEAYMINMEVIKLKRLGYTQPAWHSKAVIRDCLLILNQKLLAHVFKDDIVIKKQKEFVQEAYKLYCEKRPHYIMDDYPAFLDANNSPELLNKLQTYRDYYQNLSFHEGPYHFEVFPYLYFSPEKELLENKGRIEYDMSISSAIADLIFELNMIEIYKLILL